MASTVTLVDGIIHVVITDTLGLADLRQIADDVAKIEAETEQTPHRLTDLTACDLRSLDISQLETMARRRREVEVKNPARSAIVATTKMQYGVARMYMAIGTNKKIEMEIFESRESALTWLREDPPPNP